MFELPKTIVDGINKLNVLVGENPTSIPLIEAAKFMSVDKDALRTMLERGLCPFGIGWRRPGAERMAVKIPTVTFYMWYMSINGARAIKE